MVQVSVGVLLFAVIAAVVTPHLFSQSAGTGVSVAGGSGVYTDTRARYADAAEPANRHELRPLGIWERNVFGLQITLTFTPEHMEGRVISKTKEVGKIGIDFHADYGVTRDSVLYGVVTSAGMTDSRVRMNPDGGVPDVFKLHYVLAEEVLDQPFSMRCRVDGDVLTVKEIRFYVKSEGKDGDLKETGEQIARVGRGRYTRKRPTPTTRTP
jgi:hypothetical protein